jgi:hypothetical protein
MRSVNGKVSISRVTAGAHVDTDLLLSGVVDDGGATRDVRQASITVQ